MPDKSRRKAASRAPHDDLTGLPFGASARDALALAFREALASGHAASLAVIDVDEFRDSNRLLGIERSDQLLKAIARRLEGALPGASLVRLAGDSFAVLLSGVEPEEALLTLQAARAAVSKGPVIVGRAAARREAHPTVSVGIASGPRDGDAFEPVLARALSAVRRAKSLGRDRVATPPEDKMVMKTSYYAQTQLERLKALAGAHGVNEATLLREAIEDLLLKYKDRRPAPKV